MTEKCDVLIIDGRHLLYRTHDSFNSLSVEIDGKNVPTGGLYGFLTVATKIHARYGGAVVVAWEGRDNFRLAVYPEYKGKHQPVDPEKLEFIREMALQEKALRRFLTTLGVRQYVGVGCEADDVIGRVAHTMSKLGRSVFIYSGDSDLRQLVDDNVRTISPGKGAIKEVMFDAEAVQEKHGVSPSQIADLKALSGDSSDNIPGVRGVGPKTAATLISHYGDLKSVVKAAKSNDAGWPVAKRFIALVASAEAMLGTYLGLTTIKLDCQMKSLEVERSQSAVMELLKLYKFRSMASPAELQALMRLGK
jgi:DNA polymerase-1